MKKKLLSALLSVAMVATLFAGCGGGNDKAPAGGEAAGTEVAGDVATDVTTYILLTI